MKLIAHRGNINGPNSSEENKPEYLLSAIENGYYVELDLWFINNELFLGHDNPEYKIELSFIQENKYKMFVHCKNIEALHFILENDNSIECFFHDSDDCVLTSKGNIWTYPGKLLTERSICVMPERIERNNYDVNCCFGICSDYISKYSYLDKYICVSLGFDCDVARILRKQNLSKNGYPFDFCITPDITSIFQNHFENFFKISEEHTNYFLKNSENASTNLNAKFNNYGVGFLHHNIEDEEGIAYYKKKVDRLKNLLISEKKIIFLRTCKGERHKQDVLNFNDDIEDMKNFNKFLQKTYPNLDYEILLFINNKNVEEYNGLFTKTLKIYNYAFNNLHDTIIHILNRYKYQSIYGEPEVKNEIDTIDDIIKNKKSLIRFGDGELKLAKDKTGKTWIGYPPFEKNSSKMKKILCDILNNNNPNICVGIVNIYKNNIFRLRNIKDRSDKKDWYLSFYEKHYKALIYYNNNSTYYSAFIFRPYFIENLLTEDYVNNLKKIWEGRKICIINSQEKVKYESLFNNITDCKFIKCKKTFAFDDDEFIMKQCEKIDKDYIFILMAGPAAKVWAWELTNKGYQCIDCGNIVTWCREYNIYFKKKINYDNLIADYNFKEFFLCNNHIIYKPNYIKTSFNRNECIIETYSDNNIIEKKHFKSSGIHFKLNENYKSKGTHKLTFLIKSYNNITNGEKIKIYTGKSWIYIDHQITSDFKEINVIENFDFSVTSKYRISFVTPKLGLKIGIKNLKLTPYESK